MKIEENVNIKEHSTFKVGGQFRYFFLLTDKEEIREIQDFAEEKNLPILFLGSGSNVVFRDGVLDVIAVQVKLSGFVVLRDEETHMDIEIGAGEDWDSVVAQAVGMDLAGIEAMSAIPGTAGATPVQNVGAYGQEIKDTLISVEVYNLEKQIFENLSHEECEFKYRDSIFKHAPPAGGKGRYVITKVRLRLSKFPPTMPHYPGVKKYFEERGNVSPSLQEIRQAIIDIRSVKLPDPKEVANVGSFFKNAIVLADIAEDLKIKNPSLTTFPVDDNLTKIPAGWLVENAGLKGKEFGHVSVYAHNALVLVNDGKATFEDVIHAKNEIVETVYSKFGIRLETEPEFI
jgi:UDP-N-acetylmuramate dehydrogenase